MPRKKKILEENQNANLSNNTVIMPVLTLQGSVAFPMVTSPIGLGRPESINLSKEAFEAGQNIFIVAQRDKDIEHPSKKDIFEIGVTAKILDILTLPDNTKAALVSTNSRARIIDIIKNEKSNTDNHSYMRAQIEILPDNLPEADNMRIHVVMSMIAHKFNKMVDMLDEKETSELRRNLKQFENEPNILMNFIAFHAPIDFDVKQKILEIDDLLTRYTELLKEINKAHSFMKVREEIQQQTGVNMQNLQREQFLQQQIRMIQDELGESVEDKDFDELSKRADKMIWSDEAKEHFNRELKKLERYNTQNPEYSIQYSYLDLLLSLPWDKTGTTEFNIDKIKTTLEADHYGLEDVKERIIEQVAVMKLRTDMRAPILCLYGPPGVGKTSLGKSIAKALGREYARISLGGLHDEAEIRGHRRTYIGAMPGRIITALKKCKTNNPIFVLDEIDKIGKDFKGDPSTALLEVLDPEQNNKFHDNYVDFDYDLSNVMFIATANDLSGISRPLLDRMEIIELSSYVLDEKVQIASRHLVPKVLEDLGFKKNEISFNQEAISKLIESYTRESGVRLLEKKISKALRKVAVKKAEGIDFPTSIDLPTLINLMGPEEFTPDVYEDNSYVGVVTGLAWTQVGGEILFIETSLSPGKGDKLTLTGSLGDVMKESAIIALQYLKSHAKELNINFDDFSKYDVHIHVPEGAIPKDGPSAGITMTTALASAFTNKKVQPKLAMTGEITLRGKVLPVGGIKEKILAAKRAGITDIILCEENKRDISKIAQRYLEGLTFHYVKDIMQVLDYALIK